VVVQPLDHLAQRLDHPRHPVVTFGLGYQRRLIATEPGIAPVSRCAPAAHVQVPIGVVVQEWLGHANIATTRI